MDVRHPSWRKLDQRELKTRYGKLGDVRLYDAFRDVHDAEDHPEQLRYVVTWQLEGADEVVQARVLNIDSAKQLLESIASITS